MAKYEKLRKAEIRVLRNADFMRRMMLFTHVDPNDRAVASWIETFGEDDMPDGPFSEEFQGILKAIVDAATEAGI